MNQTPQKVGHFCGVFMSGFLKKRLLLVEDETILAMNGKIQLERYGYSVKTVTTGEKAVEAVQTSSDIDLILMDINLGTGIDGTEAAEMILQDHDIPVVFLSSHTEPEIVEKTEKITSYGYVVKSSSMTVLDASIKMAFRLFEAKTEAQKHYSEVVSSKEELEAANEELLRSEQELIKRENALSESENRLRVMLDLVPDMISIHDPEMRILYSNWSGFADVPENRRVLHTRCYKTYRDLDEECLDCLAKAVIETGEPLKEDVELPDGRWMDVRAIPLLDQNEHVVMFMEWVRDITERKRVEAELREERELANRIIEDGPVAITQVDRDGKIVFANSYAQQLLGLSQNPTETLSYNSPEWHITDIDGAPFPEEQLPFRQVMSSGRAVHDVQHAISKPGTRIILSINGAPLHDEHGRIDRVVFAIQDITERKRVEEDLNESVSRHDELESSIPVGVYVVWIRTNGDKEFEHVSDRWCTIHGVHREDVLTDAAVVDKLVHPDDRQSFVGLNVDAFHRIIPFRWEGRFFTGDGQVRWLLIESTPHLHANGDIRWFGVTQDITARKEAEIEIQKQLSEKETLLREVHHRVKNNMATIESLLSLQLGSTAHAEVKTALQDTITRVQSSRVLYDKLLVSDNLKEVSIGPYANGLVDAVAGVFDLENTITIERRIADFGMNPKKAFFLGIIINELLTNVFKYAFKDRDGGNVSVSIDKEERTVTLTIQDNGVGFDERTLKNETSGFGLTVIQMLVEQSGGTYSLSNDNGAKSVVRFEL